MSDSFNFNKGIKEIDEIIDQIRAGDLDLDEAIKKYKKAETLLSRLEKYLKDAENKLTVINPNES